MGRGNGKRPPTSDTERCRVPPQSFIRMLDTTRTKQRYVVIVYPEDKALQKMLPDQITTDWFRPRFSKLDTYQGLEELQPGLEVRVFWTKAYPHSKAEILGVGEPDEMDELFLRKKAEYDRADANPVPVAARKKQARIMRQFTSLAQQQANTQNERAALALQNLNATLASIETVEERLPDTHDHSKATSSLSTSFSASFAEHNGTFPIDDDIPNDNNGSRNDVQDDEEDETPQQQVSAAIKYLGLKKKREYHERKLAKYIELEKNHPLYVRPPKRVKLDVSKIPFSFLKSEEDDKAGLKQLVPGSAIWVDATALNALTKTAKSVSKYARQLMWDVIITQDDIKSMTTLKGKSVGFVKMFGSQNFKDVYTKICRVREMKEKNGAPGKWNIEKLKSLQDYKDLWRKYFPYRCKIEQKYSPDD